MTSDLFSGVWRKYLEGRASYEDVRSAEAGAVQGDRKLFFPATEMAYRAKCFQKRGLPASAPTHPRAAWVMLPKHLSALIRGGGGGGGAPSAPQQQKSVSQLLMAKRPSAPKKAKRSAAPLSPAGGAKRGRGKMEGVAPITNYFKSPSRHDRTGEEAEAEAEATSTITTSTSASGAAVKAKAKAKAVMMPGLDDDVAPHRAPLRSEMWCDAFRPQRPSDVEGLAKAREALDQFLDPRAPPCNPALVISAPCGNGKTSVVDAAIRERRGYMMRVTSDAVDDAVRDGGGLRRVMRDVASMIPAPSSGSGVMRVVVLDQLETLFNKEQGLGALDTVFGEWKAHRDKAALSRVVLLCDAPLDFRWRRFLLDRQCAVVECPAPTAAERQAALTHLWRRISERCEVEAASFDPARVTRAIQHASLSSMSMRTAVIDMQLELCSAAPLGALGGHGGRDVFSRSLFNECRLLFCTFSSVRSDFGRRYAQGQRFLESCGDDPDVALLQVHNNGLRAVCHVAAPVQSASAYAAELSDFAFMVDSCDLRSVGRAAQYAALGVAAYVSTIEEACKGRVVRGGFQLEMKNTVGRRRVHEGRRRGEDEIVDRRSRFTLPHPNATRDGPGSCAMCTPPLPAARPASPSRTCSQEACCSGRPWG